MRRSVYACAMNTVYAEALLALNAALDYLLLLAAGRICALPLDRRRIALGALWGGAYSLLAQLWPGFFGLATVRLLAGAVSVGLAYGTGRQALRALVVFYAASAALAGGVYALSSLRERGGPIPVRLRTLLLAFALGWFALDRVFRHRGRRAERRIVSLAISLKGRTVRLRGLEDSGNELVDPVSGRRALVAEAAALSPLFDDPAPLLLPDPAEAMEALRSQGAVCRLLPCRSVTDGAGLLLCFTPERVEVEEKERRDLLIAVSPHSLCADGEYQAVLPLESPP